MGKIVFIIMCLMGASALAASAYPPGFNAQGWAQLEARAVASGKRIDTDNGTYLVMSHIVPGDISKSHVADYFSVVGSYAGPRQFLTDHVEMVSENWQLKNGNFDIDQWQYVITTDGQLFESAHNYLVETPSGRVLDDESLSKTQQQSLQTLAARLRNWYRWMTPKINLM